MRLGRRAALLIALYMLASAATALADREADRAQSLTIESDKIDRIDKDRLLIFMGNVVAAQQRDWRLYADRMEVYLDETGNRVLKVTSIGNVRVTTSDCRKGTAERAEYYDLDQRVVLRGNARLWRGRHVIRGEAIVIHLPGVTGDCGPTGDEVDRPPTPWTRAGRSGSERAR